MAFQLGDLLKFSPLAKAQAIKVLQMKKTGSVSEPVFLFT